MFTLSVVAGLILPVFAVPAVTCAVASTFAVWVGLRYTEVTAYVLFTLVALMSIPRKTDRVTSYALAVVGVVQLVLAWVWPPTSAGSTQWLAILG